MGSDKPDQSFILQRLIDKTIILWLKLLFEYSTNGWKWFKEKYGFGGLYSVTDSKEDCEDDTSPDTYSIPEDIYGVML